MESSKRIAGLLVIPRIKVQNANIISSSLTWGFPSMTAFMGLMWALERKLDKASTGILFESVAVISHLFEPQIDQGYTKRFNLTRNPLNHKGESSPFAEEGRANMEITLVFSVDGAVWQLGDAEKETFIKEIINVFQSMRIAGGSIVGIGSKRVRPALHKLPDDAELRHEVFSRLKRQWLPGMCLVQRQDRLNQTLARLLSKNENASLIDAFLEHARLCWGTVEEQNPGPDAVSEWELKNKKQGWLVPIPVGYAAISQLHDGGDVANSRDSSTAFRFVESIYSVGEWISPHRFSHVEEMLWYNDTAAETGIYACKNSYAPSTQTH